MASLKLVTEKRNALFFGRYQYRAKVKVHGAVYTYYTKNLEEFKIKMAKKAESPPEYISVYSLDWKRRVDLIDYEQIGRYFEWRNRVDSDSYMCRIQGNSISFFSDDLRLLESLKHIDDDVEISIADLIGNNVMYFKKQPQFKYRTYFRGKRVPDSFKEEVKSFIERYNTTARICPALKRLVSASASSRRHWYNYLHSSYYVDYNDESTTTLLHMFFGSMLGKTYTLEKEPEN